MGHVNRVSGKMCGGRPQISQLIRITAEGWRSCPQVGRRRFAIPGSLGCLVQHDPHIHGPGPFTNLTNDERVQIDLRDLREVHYQPRDPT